MCDLRQILRKSYIIINKDYIEFKTLFTFALEFLVPIFNVYDPQSIF